MIRVRMTSQVHRWNNLDYLLSNHVRKTVQDRLCITDGSLLRTVLFWHTIGIESRHATWRVSRYEKTHGKWKNRRVSALIKCAIPFWNRGSTLSSDHRIPRQTELQSTWKPRYLREAAGPIPKPDWDTRELPWTSNDVQLQRRTRTHTQASEATPRSGTNGRNDTQLLNTLRQSDAKLAIFQARECVTHHKTETQQDETSSEKRTRTLRQMSEKTRQEKRVVNIVKHMLQSTTDVNVSTLTHQSVRRWTYRFRCCRARRLKRGGLNKLHWLHGIVYGR